ncbi:SDR family oxidoreductase [Thermosipho ferrireducens]|uniref:SDR family oxidoreductase n=1 Tax=Thermosipho ferrireducens TaxID=2571116 RepID=A0ABX7S5S7_9BACT|nr:SDR family oxidoreductase [Thermosipho ferrireducens]QTA37914.1 SDR family oxidoreductase [Thermosipho ferrireducens]
MKKTDKKVVIITGGNNGLGYYMAKALLEDGHKIAVFDISGENLTNLQEIYPENLLFCKCDVSIEDEVNLSVDKVIENWEKIDVLINNAALAIFKNFEHKNIEETKKEFSVNYFGYILMIKSVLPHMKKRGKGIIYNVSSGVGITGFAKIHGYASTKAAIETLTRTLAIEFEQYNISVNLIHPPLMRTKSASPLGIPPQMMEDPEITAKKLAKKIFADKKVLTPDFKTSVFLFISRMCPDAVGKFLSKMTEKNKTY